MSHANVRGQPNAAQLYLDSILNEIIEAKGNKPDAKERDRVNIAQILYHCMRKRPSATFMINGATGEVISNEEILKHSLSLARSLIAKGARGKTVLVIMRNHQRMAAVYIAVILAGVVPFLMDPNGTPYEMSYFLQLIEPCFVFCDQEHYDDMSKALAGVPELSSSVVVAEDENILREFTAGYSNDVDSFKVIDSKPEDSVMMLPTSGSTGLPKAALLTNRGLVTQLPWPWAYHTQFPKPTQRVMILTTSQWMTFTMMVTGCVAFNVPLIMSNKKVTPDNVAEMMLKFRPSWTFFSPPFAKTLLPAVTKDHLSSLETMILLGAPVTPSLTAALLEKLPKGVHLCDGYGTTETQGFIAIPDRDAPITSNGRVFNILHYKLLDEDGEELGLGQKGELYVKGDCVIQGYHKDDISYSDAFKDGWYKTGDIFYIDEHERLSYVERKKFNFKYQGCHVSPEEVERVVCSVPAVRDCVVCGTEGGPAALIILRPGWNATKEDVHRVVDSTLSDHKRLRGGIAFVDSLPQTHSGKLQRKECAELLNKLIESGQCI